MKKLFNILAVLTAVAVAVPAQAVQTRAQRAAEQAQAQQAAPRAARANAVVQPDNTAKIVAVVAVGAGLTALAVTALYNAVYGEVDCGAVKAAYCAGSEVAPVAYELCKEHLPRWCAPGFLG